jgi:hypothetical protein
MRPFGDVKKIARSLGIKTKGEWEEYAKSGNKPEDIPIHPNAVYKEEWRGWPDFLGTEFRLFEAGREFARSLGLKTTQEWEEYRKSGDRPEDIPSAPEEVYRDQWQGWRNWLGTETLPFTEAREFVHSLGIQNARDWIEYCKSGDKPRSIPATPHKKYEDEWRGWGDWLGTGRIAKGSEQWRDFEPAREFVRSLGIQDSREWAKYCISGNKPEDIPSQPFKIYKDQWRGYSDWLGTAPILWTRRALLAFLEDLRPRLGDLEETELYLILQQGGAMPGLRKALGQTTALGVLKDLQENDARGVEDALRKVADTEILEADTNGVDTLEDHTPEDSDLTEDLLEGGGLASLATPDALRLVDDLAEMHYGLDSETAQYLVDNRVAALWEAYTHTGADALDALEGDGGRYFQAIRDRFRAELDGAENLPTPAGWSFRPPGREHEAPTPPNLMQRRTAHALAIRKRLGNWSGVGSGKTIAGILASRATNRRHTLVICNKATVPGWCREIRNAFPGSMVRTAVGGPPPGAPIYTVLNYDKFQQANRRALVEDLTRAGVDFVILDEVQFVKQRHYRKVSRRREAIHALLSELETRNPDLHVLGMSATPVINTLMEARRLIEIVTGRTFADLDTQSTVNSALAMHRTLMIHGLRYRPRYELETTTEIPTVTRNDLVEELRAGEGVLHLEQTLLPPKLEAVREYIQPGTLIYTHYVEGMAPKIRSYVEGIGYRAGMYTGSDKTGLEDFLAGRVDVLIGSKPVGTGLDGLQRVCNQVLMLSLPWTSAEYEQIIGRVRRQGSAFGSVRVVVPRVDLDHDGDTWSWDGRRLDTIRFKRTLSDCALDGNIPEVARISPAELETRGRDALEAWIKRVQEGGAVEVERPRLRIPLPPETTKRLQVSRGDFATLNNRWVSSNSETVHARLREDPAEWYLYHTLYREARATWSEVPALRIAEDLKGREDFRVGDFGAGECLLRDALPHHDVVSLDHVALDDGVIACDMALTPLQDGELGAVVFSLSLMGRNWRDYLTEAHRTLRPFGLVFIAEPARRWKDGALEDALEAAGFDPLRTVRRGEFVYARGVKR